MANTVKSFYDENVAFEDARLDLGRLEYEVTLHTIRMLLKDVESKSGSKSKSKSKVADIGCGTAPYATQLAKDGQQVWACDLSSGLIEQAKKNTANANVHLEALEVCDARQIESNTSIYGVDRYDVSLLLGPMYHLLEEHEREAVLRSTVSMTKPGGYIVAAFVTQNAHLRDICTRDPGRLLTEQLFYDEYLKTGKYTRSTAGHMFHTTPEAIREFFADQEARGAGFNLLQLVSCEGFLGFQHGTHLAKLDDATFDKWLQVILQSADQEATLGAADHIIAVLQKS